MTDAGPEICRSIFGQVQTPMVLLDDDLLVCRLNDAATEALGYEQEELVGTALGEIASDPTTLEEAASTLAGGTVWRGAIDFQTSRGTVVCSSGSISPIETDGPVEFAGVFVDTTQQRNVKDASEVMNRLLRHDLRNDLNLVTGYIEEAEQYIESEQALAQLDRTRDAVDDIIHKCKRARELRDLFRSTNGGEKSIVELSTILHRELVAAIDRFDDAQFRYGHLPDVWVRGDEMLGTVFESILENAATHTDRTNPDVEVSVDERPETVLVRFGDDGPGIPDKRKSVVFGRKEQDKLNHGSGISLFLADCIVDSYGGDIWVEDNHPRGAVFVVELVRP